MTFKEIHRPSTVINKCHSFINDIKANDILVIPSAKSSYVTFALAGEYYEDDSKTLELEQNVIGDSFSRYITTPRIPPMYFTRALRLV